MTFTSFQFGLFVAIVFGAYYLPPLRRFQVQLLVLASLVFYGSGQPALLPLLLLAVLGTHLCLVLAFDNRAIWMPAGIVFNLALLAFFKYKFLLVDASTAYPIGFAPVDFLLRLPLPIGISFFVFHNISLLVDLTREKRPPTLRDVFLYIIFFPQLVSGPITRAGQFMPQIVPKQLSNVDFAEAAKWILTGFFFKLYVANNLNEMTSYMDYPLYETVATQDRWLLVFLYSYQIYADFFGYSAIALGLGLLFGYRLPVNFDLPYISASFSEFWTRWHISLSVWLRTYLYIPLGGNRKGPARTGLNLMIVMTLGGLWHGASLSYALWGMLHGLLLVVERPFLKVLGEAGPVVRVARVGVVFFCVTMLWIFFKLPSFDHALGYLAGMFTPTDNPNPTKLFRSMALLYALPVLIQHLGLGALASGRLRRWEPYLYGALAALAYLEAGPDAAFIYFQF
ncbi:UNVERIFIED_ORG: alginate O-acetyltransferase complex protein AlgI [Bradyrhizobium japonicum]|uniref:MBOAT family O-acyltransferase n=1 Tax=Bradyrhizobium TaxID=374 RepID=UPI002729E037|nr:MBOAT family O-acyltransferase [Bradyrhizobium diazoefficiens]WLA57866.1 MBOAT family O-acyltransferase [Bradyrhizobium diazoefficiens]